jgi:hypothetical protein
MSLFEVLPAELIAQILFELDPASFYICLQTSRLFRAHALASTKLLHEQLYRIPGERVFYDDVISNADYLLKLFGKRATQHLFNGVERMADMHIWRAAPSMDRKTSCIVRWTDLEHEKAVSRGVLLPRDCGYNALLFLEVKSAESIVNIYSIQDSGLTLKYVISPHMVSQHLPAHGECSTYAYTVARVATETEKHIKKSGPPRLAILYAPTHQPLDPVNDWLVVICFRLEPDHGPMITEIYRAHADTCPDKNAIVDMALNADGNPVIVHRTSIRHSTYRVVAYRNRYDETMLKRRTEPLYETLMQSPPHAEEHIGSLAIQGRNIHLCHAAIPLPYWTLMYPHEVATSRGDGFMRRDTSLPDMVESFPKQSLGRVLARHHHHRIEDKDLNDGVPTCVNTALELMIARDDVDALYGERTRQGIFLLKALQYADSCQPFDMDIDYPTLHHVFVAKLDGLALDNLSSIGLKLSVSPHAHRIAIAHWRTVLVYALDPNAFLDPAHIEANGDAVPGDYAYIEGCGWQYYESSDFERDCVILKPVQLECKGVVFGLEWRDEDELWGWTEEGVVRWRVGVDAKGRRGDETLDDTLLECPTRYRVSSTGGRTVEKARDFSDSELHATRQRWMRQG